MNGRRTVYCHYCGEKGHNRLGCPQRPAEDRKASVSNRACSYCYQPGHTKPKCEARKAAIAEFVAKNAEYRQNALQDMCDKGMGVGALIVPAYGHRGGKFDLKAENLYLITDISWDSINTRNCGTRPIIANNVTQDYLNEFGLSYNHEQHYWHWPHVVSKASAESIRASVPSNWLDGTSGVNKFFK
jgi:hypothetical protein